MKVLMFGWEFPPYISGGLGTACHGITRALSAQGVDIIFVLPTIDAGEGDHQSHVRLISASDIPLLEHGPEVSPGTLEFRIIESALKPYLGEPEYQEILGKETARRTAGESRGFRYARLLGGYGPDLKSEAVRYGEAAGEIARMEEFDIIHCHDWMTVFAGLRSREASGKPFVLHIHALEFDRSGENVNRDIYDIERHGMEQADGIIAVSHYTRNRIIERYGIPPEKISVVHNAVDKSRAAHGVRKKEGRKIILFLGRITFQKGPDYFVEAAARVLEACPAAEFVMAGAGDMRPRMVERAAELGIGRSFHFPGFLAGTEIEEIYAMSDVYVMPSVSEPFGISPLEAMLYDVPVIISKQSGVSEILRHALKVDFWDVEALAAKIISVLTRPALSEELVERSREEIRKVHWDSAAEKILEVYRNLVQRRE